MVCTLNNTWQLNGVQWVGSSEWSAPPWSNQVKSRLFIITQNGATQIYITIWFASLPCQQLFDLISEKISMHLRPIPTSFALGSVSQWHFDSSKKIFTNRSEPSLIVITIQFQENFCVSRRVDLFSVSFHSGLWIHDNYCIIYVQCHHIWVHRGTPGICFTVYSTSTATTSTDANQSNRNQNIFK